jgi:opacity protein-like surface antigen
VKHWMGLMGLVLAVAAGQAASIGTAQAADSESPRSSSADGPSFRKPLVEITPFAGFDLGGRFSLDEAGNNVPTADLGGTGSTVDLKDHFGFALAVDLRVDEQTAYGVFYSRESTDIHGNTPGALGNLTIQYLHLEGTTILSAETLLKPYLVGGLGLTRFGPEELGNPTTQASPSTKFSGSVGLGLRWPVSSHFAVRVEARGFATLVNPNAAIFCKSDQAGALCEVRGSGRTFLQGQLLAGAAFAF